MVWYQALDWYFNIQQNGNRMTNELVWLNMFFLLDSMIDTELSNNN